VSNTRRNALRISVYSLADAIGPIPRDSHSAGRAWSNVGCHFPCPLNVCFHPPPSSFTVCASTSTRHVSSQVRSPLTAFNPKVSKVHNLISCLCFCARDVVKDGYFTMFSTSSSFGTTSLRGVYPQLPPSKWTFLLLLPPSPFSDIAVDARQAGAGLRSTDRDRFDWGGVYQIKPVVPNVKPLHSPETALQAALPPT